MATKWWISLLIIIRTLRVFLFSVKFRFLYEHFFFFVLAFCHLISWIHYIIYHDFLFLYMNLSVSSSFFQVIFSSCIYDCSCRLFNYFCFLFGFLGWWNKFLYFFSILTWVLGKKIQPGYLRELLPESAPTRPDTLQEVLNGTVYLSSWLIHFPSPY